MNEQPIRGIPLGYRVTHTLGVVTVVVDPQGRIKVNNAQVPLSEEYVKYCLDKTQKELDIEVQEIEGPKMTEILNGYTEAQREKARNYFKTKEQEEDKKDSDTTTEGGIIIP